MGFTISNGKYDTIVANFIFRNVVKWWTDTTGRDNILLAKIMLVIGVTLINVEALIEIVTATGIPWSGAFGLAFWSLIGWIRWLDINRCVSISEDFTNGADAIKGEHFETINNIIFIRKIWFWISVLFAPLSIAAGKDFWFESGCFMMAMSLYAALSFRGRGKSVWQRAKEKVAAWAQGLSWQPALQPISVRMGGIDGQDERGNRRQTRSTPW